MKKIVIAFIVFLVALILTGCSGVGENPSADDAANDNTIIPELPENVVIKAGDSYHKWNITATSFVVSLDSGTVLDSMTVEEVSNSNNYLIMGYIDVSDNYVYQKLGWNEPTQTIYTIPVYHAFSNIDSARSDVSVSITLTAYADYNLIPPLIILTGDNPMAVNKGATFSDPGAVVKDWGVSDIAASVTGSVDTSTEGTYLLTYSASNDSDGNVAVNIIRTVNVVPMGSVWSSHDLPDTSYWKTVMFGNNTFVAISKSKSAVSSDGKNWIAGNLPNYDDWKGASYGNGVFVVLAGDDSGNNSTKAATSSDGITWTLQNLPTAGNWCGITYGNNTFVAVSQDGGKVVTSIDGITWTARTIPTAQYYCSVVYGNNTFVAVAHSNSITATSTDGEIWVTHADALPAPGLSVTFGEGLFVAVNYGSNIAATSIDGITWTQRDLPSSAKWCSVTYGNGVFTAIAGEGSTHDSITAATSEDGITWTARTLPAAADWNAVTFGNDIFVAVAGSGGYAATSP